MGNSAQHPDQQAEIDGCLRCGLRRRLMLLSLQVVVVSAMGSHESSPIKVTDLLLNMVAKAARQDEGFLLDLAALQVRRPWFALPVMCQPHLTSAPHQSTSAPMPECKCATQCTSLNPGVALDLERKTSSSPTCYLSLCSTSSKSRLVQEKHVETAKLLLGGGRLLNSFVSRLLDDIANLKAMLRAISIGAEPARKSLCSILYDVAGMQGHCRCCHRAVG